MAEHVGVDPAREAGPAVGQLARECLMHGEPVAGGEPRQLVAVQDLVARPRGQQQKTAVLATPDEVPADRAAQLQLITGTELVAQIRRDLAVLESFDRQRERCVLRRRGDRVRALCLVAVLGGETDVDVLAGDVSGPAESSAASIRREDAGSASSP